MNIVDRPSPNFGTRLEGPIDMLVLHYTGMQSCESALERLCDPASSVSCHWLIDEDGTVYRLVDEAMRAWHAGVAFWAGCTDINSRSIGVELVNLGHEFGYRPFPAAQMAALAELAAGIVARHPIPPYRVLGHSDVAPARKQDPGELFDWAGLAAKGIGAVPQHLPPDTPVLPIDEALHRIGYADSTSLATRRAFQRHWRQTNCDGAIDPETARIATAIDILCSAQKSLDSRNSPP